MNGFISTRSVRSSQCWEFEPRVSFALPTQPSSPFHSDTRHATKAVRSHDRETSPQLELPHVFSTKTVKAEHWCEWLCLIVRSPFRAKHHVVVQYMARWMKCPLPPPPSTPLPQPQTPTPLPHLDPPMACMTCGRQGGQGRIDNITGKGLCTAVALSTASCWRLCLVQSLSISRLEPPTLTPPHQALPLSPPLTEGKLRTWFQAQEYIPSNPCGQLWQPSLNNHPHSKSPLLVKPPLEPNLAQKTAAKNHNMLNRGKGDWFLVQSENGGQLASKTDHGYFCQPLYFN